MAQNLQCQTQPVSYKTVPNNLILQNVSIGVNDSRWDKQKVSVLLTLYLSFSLQILKFISKKQRDRQSFDKVQNK